MPTLIDLLADAGAGLPDEVVVKQTAGILRYVVKFNPNHAPAGSENGGQFTSGDGGGDAKHEPNKYDAMRLPIPKGPYRKVESAEEALSAIAKGEYIEMPANQVSVMLDKLADIAKDAEAKGEQAPRYNLCQVTVSDTNLFCAEAKGIPRAIMPQLDDKEGFREFLHGEGVRFTNTDLNDAYLRATQTELDGVRVAQMMKAGPSDDRIFVSSDNYILDGHHRWAATVGADFKPDAKVGDLRIPVTRVDLPISVLLVLAEKFGGTSHRPMGKDYRGVIVKASSDDMRYTLSVVYPASDPDEPWVDAHREWATADELQKAQWDYVERGDRNIYAQHGMLPGIGMKKLGAWVDLVSWPKAEEWEFRLPTGEMQKHTIPAGSVYMGIKWTPEAWPAVKAGRIRGLSFGGRARRIVIDRSGM